MGLRGAGTCARAPATGVSHIHGYPWINNGWISMDNPWILTLVVNEMIRLAGIKFEKVVKRSPRLGDSQHSFSEDSHNCLESAVRYQKAEAENEDVRDISAPRPVAAEPDA
eukprot:5403353-Prymnesium_polylepis.1